MEGGHGYKKGFWSVEEDRVLIDYVKKHGIGKWNRIAKVTGLKRCGKSCRLRWINYLNPDVKRGDFSKEEEDLIIRLHKLLGNRWSLIAGRIPGRTDNQVKNYWNTHLSKGLGVKKEKNKIWAPATIVQNEPKDNCNGMSKSTRPTESIGEGDMNFASTHERIIIDDFVSAFYFADSELNLYSPYFLEPFPENFLGL